MTGEFEPHEVTWTTEKVARFWAYLAPNPFYEDTYFSRQRGDAIIDTARRYIPPRGRVLDFGCGPGFLLEKLLERGIVCQGAEFSAESVALVERKLGHHPLFGGVALIESLPAPLEDGAFDVIFLIETIEHLLPDDLPATLRELSRLARRGGHVVITTPNAEQLEARKIICPDCGAIFHRVQHVNSWNAATLSSLMESFGFTTIECKATTLRPPSKLNALREIRAKLSGEKRPHLVYIGQK